MSWRDFFRGAAASKNVLPGVPLCEQPFFADHFNPSRTDPLTCEVARGLHENGFAVLKFPDDDFDELAENIKSSLRDRYDWAGWKKGTIEGLRLTDAWRWNEHVRALAVNKEILKLLSRVYGRKAIPFQTLDFPVGTQQHFHTDSVHFSSIPERFMCGVWVALEDIHVDAGPLIYYPGSHRWPIYTNEHIGYVHTRKENTRQDVYHALWQRLVQHHGIEPLRLVVPKGQALIWAANLLHGGDRQRDLGRTRWSQVTHYYFEGCSYYTPMHSNPAIGSVAFREPDNVLDGSKLVNTYLGERVDPEFIRYVNPNRDRAAGRAQPPIEEDFDVKAYLQLNPDVAEGGMNPYEHYMRHGRFEGRRWK